MSDRLRVFVSEDSSLVRDGLRAMINAQPDMLVIGEAADGLSTCEQVLDLAPDVVLMDVSLPKLNGAEATRRLKRSRPDIRVVALTFHGDRTYARQLLEAGAVGYLLKRGVPEEVIRAIRIVAGGGTYVDPEVADSPVVIKRAAPGTDAAGAGERGPQELSAREEQILRLVARGYTNKLISAQLDLAMETVETTRAAALKKLGLDSRAEIVRYAMEQGWL
jgi:DNA-binding NarL/FixJ family response regulator